MLVSPLVIRTACHMVRAPRATATVLIEQNTFYLIHRQDSKRKPPCYNSIPYTDTQQYVIFSTTMFGVGLKEINVLYCFVLTGSD